MIIRIAFQCVWGLTVLVWLMGIFLSKRTVRRTSLLLALAGSALSISRGGCILGWGLVAATYAVKIRQEEQLMAQTFPDAYPRYAERVKAFIPGIL
jgi:protein-S-isoprenylcysteine O-methyltransferase Ste14